MTQKSLATSFQLSKAMCCFDVMKKLNDLCLDVINVDYNAQSIEITKPNDDLKIVDLARVCSKDNISTMILNGFKVWWKNPKVNKGEWYGKA